VLEGCVLSVNFVAAEGLTTTLAETMPVKLPLLKERVIVQQLL